MTPARYILLLLLASFFALVGVAQRAHGIYLGYRVSRLQEEKDLLACKNRELVCEISALSDPARIAGQVERLKIPLMDPVQLSKATASPERGEPESLAVRRNAPITAVSRALARSTRR